MAARMHGDPRSRGSESRQARLRRPTLPGGHEENRVRGLRGDTERLEKIAVEVEDMPAGVGPGAAQAEADLPPGGAETAPEPCARRPREKGGAQVLVRGEINRQVEPARKI